MHFQLEMLENRRKNIFRDEETRNKVPLMLLDVKVLTKTQELHYWRLSTNKQGRVYVFSI